MRDGPSLPHLRLSHFSLFALPTRPAQTSPDFLLANRGRSACDRVCSQVQQRSVTDTLPFTGRRKDFNAPAVA